MKDIINLLDDTLGNSYSIYSGCRVACVLVFPDVKICGCNVENASYGLSICAERSAVCSAISKGLNMKDVKEIYIKSNKNEFFTPCGACLQVLGEFVNTEVVVNVLNAHNEIQRYKFYELFPVSFGKDKLK